MSQLTFEGGEEPPGQLPRRKQPPLSPAQMDVMRHLRRVGHIRPVEAGLILYAHTEASEAAVDRRARYASSDGSEMLRRMAKRGLVHREAPGRWVEGPGEPPRQRRSELVSPGGFVPPPTMFTTMTQAAQRLGAAATGVSFALAAFRISFAARKVAGGG